MALESLASASSPAFRTQRFWLRTATCPQLSQARRRPCTSSTAHSVLTVCCDHMKLHWDRIDILSTGNYLENQPSVAIALLVAGVQYPLWSAGLGAAWLVFRIAYAVGYTREDKSGGEGRLIGAPFWFAQLGLFGLTLWTGVQMLL